MTNQEAAEKIENMFDAQLDGSALHDALDGLQCDLIGEAAVWAMRERRFKAYQESHKWLYPNIYGPVDPPAGRNQILTRAQIAETVLEFVNTMKKSKP